MVTPITGKKAICFDIFSTLCECHNCVLHQEYEPLGLNEDQWNDLYWNPSITLDRGLGNIRSPREMMERACQASSWPVTEAQIDAATAAHVNRMRLALCDLPEEVLPTLKTLKERGYRLAVISDCDFSDIAHWEDSPLKPLMDAAVFSCVAKVKKPDQAIFNLALKELGCRAEEAVYVGDGGSCELQGAKGMGFTTVRTEYLKKRSEKERTLLDGYSDRVIDHFSTLAELLPSLR